MDNQSCDVTSRLLTDSSRDVRRLFSSGENYVTLFELFCRREPLKVTRSTDVVTFLVRSSLRSGTLLTSDVDLLLTSLSPLIAASGKRDEEIAAQDSPVSPLQPSNRANRTASPFAFDKVTKPSASKTAKAAGAQPSRDEGTFLELEKSAPAESALDKEDCTDTSVSGNGAPAGKITEVLSASKDSSNKETQPKFDIVQQGLMDLSSFWYVMNTSLSVPFGAPKLRECPFSCRSCLRRASFYVHVESLEIVHPMMHPASTAYRFVDSKFLQTTGGVRQQRLDLCVC